VLKTTTRTSGGGGKPSPPPPQKQQQQQQQHTPSDPCQSASQKLAELLTVTQSIIVSSNLHLQV